LTRKNVLTLSAAERTAFIDALLALKKKGRYDWYVRTHVDTMMKVAVFPYEPPDMNYRNRAHSGPVFLPWHRKLLAEFEADLRKIDKSLTLPYWDWTGDGDSADPRTSALWADDLLGGDGTGPGDIVETGPFAGKAGNWPIDPKLDPDKTGPALVRKFQTIVTSLPTSEHVKFLMREAFYDVPPLSAASVAGFRNRLEGWLTRRLDYRYTTDGSQMHNRVHLWVGGNIYLVFHFDPYPFIFLNLAFSTQAAYAAPLILLAQNRQDDRDRVALEEDRARAQRTKADTEYLARELASLRLAVGEVVTRDFLRSELVRLFEFREPSPPDSATSDRSRSERPGGYRRAKRG